MPTFTETPSMSFIVSPSSLGIRTSVEKPSVGPVILLPSNVALHSHGTWTDPFNRSDSNTITDATHPWVENESVAQALQILTNQLRAVSDDGSNRAGFAYWDQDPGEHQFSELEFRAHNAGLVNARSGPAARIQTSSTHTSFTGYVALCDPGAGQIDLRKYESQSLLTVPLAGTSLGTAAVTFTAGLVVRIEPVDTLITVRAAGNIVIEVTDTSITGGRPGIVVVPGYTVG